MSKHKRFHGIHTRAQRAKAYAFFHSNNPYGSVKGLARLNILAERKKTAASSAKADDGKGTAQDS